MLSDEFKHEVNAYMGQQAAKLMSHQASIASAAYSRRTGSLTQALQSQPEVHDCTVNIPYPVHIRFLDMKMAKKRKDGSRRKKSRYVPIYNKYVFGYLKTDIWKKLNADIPEQMIRAIGSTFKDIKKI